MLWREKIAHFIIQKMTTYIEYGYMGGTDLFIPTDIPITPHYGKFLPNRFPDGLIRPSKAKHSAANPILCQ